MKKLLILLITISFNAFAVQYTLGNKKIELDTFSKENYVYINSENLKTFGINQEIKNSKLILKSKGLNVEFSDKKVNVNGKTVYLTNSIFVKNNKFYVDMPFVMEILNYSVNDKKIMKANSYSLPLKEGKYLVSKKAKRIISMAPGITEKLYEINAFAFQIARTDFCNYPISAKKLPSIGTMFSPNMEKIISLKPDLILGETHFNEKIIKKLQDAGIEVLVAEAPKNFDDMYRLIKKMGYLTDKEYEARAVVASMKNKVTRTKFVLKNEKNKPKVYYALGTGKGEYTAGKDTFLSELIRTAGGVNTGDVIEGWVFSLEKLVMSNPDIIFGPKYSIDTMISLNSYKNLKAIKNKSYFVVDENIFNLSGPRLIDTGLKTLVTKFHPNKIKELGY